MKKGWFKRFIVRILELDDTPKRIAWGVALGTFIGMTPTVGLQMTIAVCVATLLRGNRLAAVAMVWISNPLTVVPIYWVDHIVGATILGTEMLSISDIAQVLEFESTGLFSIFFEFLGNLGKLTWNVLPSMFLGGAILGVLLALPAYFLTLKAVHRYRARKRVSDEAIDEPSESRERVAVETDSEGSSKEGDDERGEDSSG